MVPAIPSARAAAAYQEKRSDVATIAAAPLETLESVLAQQPEWVIALLRAHSGNAPALQEYVERLPSERSARIGALIKSARASVKPKVREIVMRGVAAELERSAGRAQRR